VNADEIPAQDGKVVASISVTNTGDLEGIEVVQLYASVRVSGITCPALQLLGFKRVQLRLAVSATVTFEFDTSLLSYSGIDGRFTLQSGDLELIVGRSSADDVARSNVKLVGRAADLEARRSYLSEARVTMETKVSELEP
jgi:hypothetical protein